MTQETPISFSAETGKVLQLMIHSLYTNKDIFLRELISNASDACDKLRYGALIKPELTRDDAEFKITVTIDKDARRLTIVDNGIGMNREDLVTNLGTIAKSGTQEFMGQLTGDSKKDLALIGQFGVGFYASFMVADKVEVTSRKAGEDQAWLWVSDGLTGFTVKEAPEAPRGTSITMYLKDGEGEYLDKFRIRHIIQTYSDHISFPITLIDEEGKTETINTASALWARPKSDITPEQYKEFYHHVAHSPDEPWMTLHNKAEGKIEYTNLLYIPTIKPFDLYHPDRKRRVKLYVKRVFITEENIDLVPHYMRFLRGIIDSEDLPLNISRETLQKNPMLDKIRESVTSRVLSELKKKAEKEPEAYAKFWANFGPVLKEGLCEAIAPREQILEACRFYSTKSPDKLISLDEYITRMKDKQEQMFYITGDSVKTLLKSPQLEGFIKRDVEVLLLSDHVDDFWVGVARKFKDKEFKSATRADIDLSALGDVSAEEKKEAPKAENLDKFIALLKQTYGEDVADVRVSKKLSDSPVCLVVGEGQMEMRMERFLADNKQLPGVSARILEINPDHVIIKALMARSESGNVTPETEDALKLLLDQARIQEGEPISDPQDFSRRVSEFLKKGLAA